MADVSRVRFGPFEFDSRTGELVKFDTRIHLQEQAAAILTILTGKQGDVVLRSEIRERLWLGDTVVDFDQGINSAVKRLRNALNDSAEAPRYIETISKRGYRFIAKVERATETAPEPPAPSRYRILEPVRAEEPGAVYKAEDRNLGRPVAVRLLPVADGETPQAALRRWQKEARPAASLNHPSIRAIYEVEEFDGAPALIMEPVPGESLDERLARGPLSLAEALPIAIQTASALAEAHEAGVAHGALAPNTVLLTKNGVKAMGFGLSAGGSVAEDICGLGRLLYRMLTGRVAPDPIGSAGLDLKGVPPAVALFLARCLAPEAQSRWPSAAEAVSELERIVAQVPRPETRQAREGAWWRWAAGIAVLGLGLSVFLLRDRGPQAFPAGAPTRAIPLTTLKGRQNYPAFSPDGEKVAFSWVGPAREGGKAMNIYVKSLATPELTALSSGHTVDTIPQWSPDGSRIAFQRDGNPNELMIVPSSGGVATKIADMGVGIAWSPAGDEIAYVSPITPAGILVRSLKTGAVRQITHPSERWERMLAWSPDGKWIAFGRQLENSVRELFVVPAGGGEERRLTFDNQVVSGMAWTPDSRELIFDSSRQSGGNLWRISASGGAPRPVAGLANNPAYPTVSLRGARLAWSESFEDTNILEFDRSSGGETPFVPRSKCVICSAVEDDSPRFSPDGSRIVFVSRRNGAEELWVANGDGSAPRQLTLLASRSGSPRWSPDGRWIAFDSRVRGNAEIYVIGAQGGSPRRLTDEPSRHIEPSWSHDGRWIYFSSDRGRERRIWKAPFEGGAARPVTVGFGGESVESPDGRLLYYFGDRIRSVPVNGGPEVDIAELKELNRTRAWTVRPEGIYYYDDSPFEGSAGTPSVRLFSFATRKIVTVLTPARATPPGHPGIDLSPDGRRLLYTQSDRTVDALMMTENFR